MIKVLHAALQVLVPWSPADFNCSLSPGRSTMTAIVSVCLDPLGHGNSGGSVSRYGSATGDFSGFEAVSPFAQ
jgi:hypothetical protein